MQTGPWGNSLLPPCLKFGKIPFFFIINSVILNSWVVFPILSMFLTQCTGISPSESYLKALEWGRVFSGASLCVHEVTWYLKLRIQGESSCQMAPNFANDYKKQELPIYCHHMFDLSKSLNPRNDLFLATVRIPKSGAIKCKHGRAQTADPSDLSLIKDFRCYYFWRYYKK